MIVETNSHDLSLESSWGALSDGNISFSMQLYIFVNLYMPHYSQLTVVTKKIFEVLLLGSYGVLLFDIWTYRLNFSPLAFPVDTKGHDLKNIQCAIT
jgi:hypothetical protein